LSDAVVAADGNGTAETYLIPRPPIFMGRDDRIIYLSKLLKSANAGLYTDGNPLIKYCAIRGPCQ